MKIEEEEEEMAEDEERSLMDVIEDDYASDSSMFRYPYSHEIEEIPSPGSLTPSYFQPRPRLHDDEDEIHIVGPARTGNPPQIFSFRGPSLISSMFSFFGKPPHQQIPRVLPPGLERRIVIKMHLDQNPKKTSKAFNVAAGVSGVVSIALESREGKLIVVGEVDPAELTVLLRKKLGFAEIASIYEILNEKKKEG